MSAHRTGFVGLLTCLGLAVTACGGANSSASSDAPSTRTPGPPVTSHATPAPSTSHSSSTSATGPAPSTGESGGHGGSSSTGSCVDGLVTKMTPDQRAGQLLMVGVDGQSARQTVGALIAQHHVGNVVYLGGWYGSSTVAATSAYLQGEVSRAATGGTGLFVAADQEGGQVQQLKGSGFTTIPSALQQAEEPLATLRRNASTIGRELKRAGINVDLAPVADTVPASIGTANGPIGRYDREYGHTPEVVGRAVPQVVRGLHNGGVATAVKHFPGIGRISANTDVSATGITDSVMTRHDSFLQPFAAGIRSGTDMVMVGFARYPKIDATNQAAFSPTIISGMLRGDLKFDGLVITDDLNAAAVRDVPVGQRAVKFIAAGGDMALTGASSAAPSIIQAITSKAADDKGFAAKVRTAVKRVLTLKTSRGLTSCSK